MPVTDGFDEAAAEFLLSASGQAALEELRHEDLAPAHTLTLLTRLRRRLPAHEAGAVLMQARLRRDAESKFPDAAALFFTPEALQQATAFEVALHRARQIDAWASPGPVLDLGCGIGGDLLALAQVRQVLAYEREPVRARFARANAAAVGLAGRVEVHEGDWRVDLAAGRLSPAAGAFADPARRRDGRRLFSLAAMEPPLVDLHALRTEVPLLAVKVTPGVNLSEVPPDWAVEFVSHDGVCKEAVLWSGERCRRGCWASVHDGRGWHELAATAERLPVGDLNSGDILYEPDPAVIRAGAVAAMGARLDAHLFDPQIAYLVASTLRPEPLARAFAVDEVHPFSLKRLNQRLQQLGIGQVELKKRGFPLEPEKLRPELRLTRGGRAAVVFFTRKGAGRLMILARRLSAGENWVG